MRPGDADEVHLLMLRCLDEYFRPEMPLYFLGQWPRGSLVACDFSGGIAGYIAGALLSGGRASVSLLCVRSDLRGRGIGGDLLRRLMVAAMAEGVRTVQLEVRRDNADAVRFYTRRGFAVEEVLPSFYSDGGDALRMRAPVRSINCRFERFYRLSGCGCAWKMTA